MSKAIKSLVAVVLCGSMVVVPGYAIFGIGDIVFDPSNWAEAADQLVQMEEQVKQLKKTYDHMTEQAKYIKNMGPYRTANNLWSEFIASNTYSTTGPWTIAVNTGKNINPGWTRATVPLVDYGASLSDIPGAQLQRRKVEFGTLELQEGSGMMAMETVGRIRYNAPQIETAMKKLEADALSDDPALQTEAAQLNKANAIALAQVKMMSDQNKLLAANTEILLMGL